MLPSQAEALSEALEAFETWVSVLINQTEDRAIQRAAREGLVDAIDELISAIELAK